MSDLRRSTALGLLAMTLVAGSGAAADSGWTLRLHGLGTDYHRTRSLGGYPARNELELDGGFGLEVAGEYRFGGRSGIELSAARLAVEAEERTYRIEVVSLVPFVTRESLELAERGHLVVQPFAFGYLFHILKPGPVDLYLGAQAAYVSYDGGQGFVPDREDEFGYGAKLGVEWRPGRSPWSLGLELRHLEVAHEGQDHDFYGDLGLTTLGLGVAYRFGPRGGG